MLMLSSVPYLLQDLTGIDLFTVNIRTIYVIEWSTALPTSLTVLIVFFRVMKTKKEENCIEKIDQLYIYRFSSGSGWAEPELNLSEPEPEVQFKVQHISEPNLRFGPRFRFFWPEPN